MLYGETEKLDAFKNYDLSLTENFDTNINGEEENDVGDLIPDLPELQPTAQTQLDENNLSFMAAAKTDNAETQYAPRVISGELAFLVRSALTSAIYGEPGKAGWGLAGAYLKPLNVKISVEKPVLRIIRKLLGTLALAHI